MTSAPPTRLEPRQNILIVGGSYVGLAVAQELISLLEKEDVQGRYRVVLVEKCERFGHLFAYPRFAILPGHEEKAFIPVSLAAPHLLLRAELTSLGPTSAILAEPIQFDGADVQEIAFEAVVLASGTRLSPPGTIPGGGSKKEGVRYLKGMQGRLKEAERVIILGGGAVGIQMATDLAVLYPQKSITLIHSHPRLMNRFHPLLHETILTRFDKLGVQTILGSRAVIPAEGFGEEVKEREVRTLRGERVGGDYVIQSTGQTPNTGFLTCSFAPSALTPAGYIRVNSALQVTPTEEPEAQRMGGRMFAVGDVADSGAPKAARPGLVQAGVVARNLVAFLLQGKGLESYETYHPTPAAIHLTLGMIESLVFRNPPSSASTPTPEKEDQVHWLAEPTLIWKMDGKEDMGIEGVWERRATPLEGGRKRKGEEYHL